MAVYPLDVSLSVALNGSGNGTAQLGPRSGQRWDITSVTVSTVSQAAPLPSCKVYAGPVANQAFVLDATFTGNGDSTGRNAVVYPGSYVWAVWSAGTAADTATIRVIGTMTNGYRGAGNG